MSQTVAISVLLGTFNGARYLKHQLACLTAQDLLPTELLACDDGSTDETMEILEDYARSAPFKVTVQRNKSNLGPGPNFFNLCRQASGTLIAFCDQDDDWHPSKLAVCAQHLEETGALLVGHSVGLMDSSNATIGEWKQGMIDKAGTWVRNDPWANYLGMSIVLDRRLIDLFDMNRRSELINPHGKAQICHDQWFDFLAESLGRISYIKTPLASYRLHDSNISGVGQSLAGKLFQLKIDAGFTALPERQLSLAAEKRASLLLDLSRTLEAPYQDALVKSSDRWTSLSDVESRRTQLYTTNTFAARPGLFAKLVSSGVYRGWPTGGVGPLLAVKDLMSGVMKL